MQIPSVVVVGINKEEVMTKQKRQPLQILVLFIQRKRLLSLQKAKNITLISVDTVKITIRVRSVRNLRQWKKGRNNLSIPATNV